MKRSEGECGTCVCYLTDEDEHGNVAEFHHNRNSEQGFCSVRDLFHVVRRKTKACDEYIFDSEGKS